MQSKNNVLPLFTSLFYKDGAREKIHSEPVESSKLQYRTWPVGKPEAEWTFQQKYPGVVSKQSTPSNR